VASARLMVLLAVLAAAVTGCATVPTSGAARNLPGNGGAPEAFVQPLPPPPPQPGWSPTDVVDGFLQASASGAAAARRYLAPGVQWQPPASVTVVNNNLLFGITSNPRLGLVQVNVTGQRLASLSDSGQYRYGPGSASYTFTLGLHNNVWLIESLPAQQTLLLTQTDFQEVYQPRNLYFFSQLGDALVPDPVFAPVQGANAALSTDLAANLVNGLIKDRGSWLSGVTRTDFPAGTRLLSVSISDQVAVVNLGGAASTATPAQREGMYLQLQQTLTSPAYSQAIATSVQMEIDGAVQYPSPVAAGLTGAGGSAQSRDLYFADGDTVKQLGPGVKSATTLALPSLGAGITAVAASPVGRAAQLAVAVPEGRGCELEVQDAAGVYSSYRVGSGGACTSLSWDDSGDLWAVAGGRVWVLQPGYSAPAQVSVPSLPAGSRVLAVRLAADNVRAAMLVQAPSGTQMTNQLLLSAVLYTRNGLVLYPTVPIGTDLGDPTAISWYGTYYLVAIDGPEIYEVPLTGGQSQPLGPVPPGGAVSITSDGAGLAVTTSSGRVTFSAGPDSGWSWSAKGTAVAYPG